MYRTNKILVVDDDPTNVEIVGELVGDDYQLKTATTGEQALQMEYFTRLRQSGEVLLKMVNDLLDLAKFEARKMMFTFAP